MDSSIEFLFTSYSVIAEENTATKAGLRLVDNWPGPEKPADLQLVSGTPGLLPSQIDRFLQSAAQSQSAAAPSDCILAGED